MLITKEFKFEAAHRLESHAGKCHNLHGHSYRVEVAFAGELASAGPSSGMVVDFGDVSKVMNAIISEIDHKFLMAEDNQTTQLYSALEGREVAHLYIPTSTAEHLAEWFAARILVLPSLDPATLERVTVWETATSSATWRSRLTNPEA